VNLSAERRVVLARDLGELWLALVEGDRVAELRIRPEAQGRWLGTIAKGLVTRVAPGVRAVFVDVGLGRDVFTIRPEAAVAPDGRPLAVGDEVVVQIVREADGGKGHRATPSVTLPGWSLVLSPRSSRSGVSQRIVDAAERQRLRAILDELAPPGFGLIARTAAAGADRADLEAELELLLSQWATIAERARDLRAPAIVHREQDPALAFLRDHLAQGLSEIVVGEVDLGWLEPAIAGIGGEHVPRLRRHDGPLPLVEAYRLDRALEEVLAPGVPLPGGGRLVIQSTEALVAIDVNSGRDVQAPDLEETAYRTNLAAATEVARQIRLRDLAGLIVIDFIDMDDPAHRAEVDAALAGALAADRHKLRVIPLSDFCVAQITRQRRRPTLERLLGRGCAVCGKGTVLRPEAEARRLLRQLRIVARPHPVARLRVSAPGPVLEAARQIAEEFGPRSGLPPLERVTWSEGPAQVEAFSVRG
jgi:Rne/Rng family ribonuclease